MIQPGTIFAERYEILNHIGSGGMADVYRAKCHKLNRYVAVKVLRKEHNEDEDFVRRFDAEAQATAGFSHPNIVGIYDAGVDHGYHFIVMELCEGTTLKRYIRRYGRLSVRETVDFAIQISRGIEAAHQEGIIHRDIKPQNILVSQSGKIKVADFGIARVATGATQSPEFLGSVHYLSPEQARGKYADKRSDIYALGITIYEMATGKLPFDGENNVAIALMHIKDEITPPRCFFPDIPESLEKIILKCTMKRPSERYNNVSELLTDLENVFTFPEGEYVEMVPDQDDSPTIIRTPDEVKDFEEKVKQISQVEEEDMIWKEDEGQEDTQEEEPKRNVMLYVVTVLGGLALAGIVIYLAAYSLGIIGKDKTTEPAESTTGAIEQTTQVEQVRMPNVLNQDRRTAEKRLKDLGLKVSFVYDDDVENDDANLIVVDQEYKARELLAKGTMVQLTLGIDPEATTEEDKRVEVPLLLDMTEEEAVEELEKVGLEVSKVYASSDTVKSGYIIKQNPTAGTEVDLGFTITITISRGMSQVQVPSLIGLSREQALYQLNNVGLNLGEVTSDYNGSVGVGDVFEQDIQAGTMVDRGTSVSVVISLGDIVTYHYEGQVALMESPFADEDETGTLRLDLLKDGNTTTILTQEGIKSSDFPFYYSFEADDEGDAEVIVYINDEEYTTVEVTITAVED